MTPKAWLDALHAAEAAGKIPNIPVATANADGVPTYGNLDGSQMPVCSAAYKCRSPGQIWDAPDGKIAISFDDGPVPGSSDDLYTFLQKNSIPSTHFLIGINILNNWKEFNTVFNMKRDIAVHTWTHAHMPTLTSEQVIAELGWTMQIIFNSTGGLLPRFWRPPLGYTDTRVDAIAKEVFGLQTIMWNHDTFDWSLTTTMGITNATYIQSEFQGWLTGSKSPGLIVLEHELSAQSVGAFVSAYPLMKQNGWDIVSAAAIGQAGGAYGSTTATDILGNMDPALKAAATGNGTSGKPALSAVSNSTVKSVGVESTNGTTNGTTTSDATRPAAAAFALVYLVFAFVSSV